jgi:hypothetical protein
MAKRQAGRLQSILERRPEDPGLDVRDPRDRVHPEDAVETAKVEGDDAAVPIPRRRLDATDNARAATASAKAIMALRSASSRGYATQSGGLRISPRTARITSTYALP